MLPRRYPIYLKAMLIRIMNGVFRRVDQPMNQTPR